MTSCDIFLLLLLLLINTYYKFIAAVVVQEQKGVIVNATSWLEIGSEFDIPSRI